MRNSTAHKEGQTNNDEKYSMTRLKSHAECDPILRYSDDTSLATISAA